MDEGRDSQAGVSQAILRFFSGTFLSRITGLGRDVAMAAAFGSSASVAALMMAFRFSHLLRRLLGEGALQTAFIPYFEKLRGEYPTDAFRFFRDLRASLIVLLVVLIALGEIGLIATLYRGGLTPENREIYLLTSLMLPSLLFICLFGIDVALLQCENRFFIPGAAPVAFNLVWIAGVLIFWKSSPNVAMIGLSVAIVIACLSQWMMTSPSVYGILRDNGAKGWTRPGLFSEHVRALIWPLFLGTVGVGASQINNALDYVYARYADPSGPAYLWYAIRLEQMPVGLFGVALSGALLPALSRVVRSGDLLRYQELLLFSLQKAIGWMVPISFATGVMGIAAVDLVYARGGFDGLSVSGTVWCLWGYALGILPSVVIMVLAPALYAQGNYRSPMIASALSVVVNIALNALFIFVWNFGAFSVALATSLAACFNCFCLMVFLKGVSPFLSFRPLLLFFFKVTLISAAASGAVVLSYRWLGDPTLSLVLNGEFVWSHSTLKEQAVRLLMEGGIFASVLLPLALLLRVEEVAGLVGLFRRRRRQPQKSQL